MQRDDAHKRPRPALAIGLVLLALTSTTTCKETPAAKVTAPKTLPAFLPEFVQWSTSARARGKAADGVKALGGNDFKRARGLLTEAVSLDPSWIAARLDLARLYVLAGHEDVAMRLLQPLSEGDEACGGCVDAFEIGRASCRERV